MPPSFSGETSQCDCALESRTISEELAPQQQSGLGSPQSLPHKNSPQLWTSLSTNILLDAVLEKKISRSTRTAMSILLGMEWLDEAEFFKNHSVYFSSNQIGSDFVMPRLLMGDTNRCGSDEPFLLMLVPSVGNDSVVREAIRRTWASPAYPHFLKWPMGVNFTEKVKLVFVFGRNESLHNSKDTTLYTTTTTNNNNTLLMAEQQKYGDIVQYDFMDTYRNLTLKMMTAFHWMVNYCSKATFVLKADMVSTFS
ncbi:beta-1,3-galactosyltransferase 4-like [Littorina saxatilis]|uniref:beta-1,3-galactosyltransferase 4-like n=1 Tax=Littorina saxatilis TaxID=31220 RepID=UPI0038B52077